MIIITRDTTVDKWIRHRLYDTTTGIRYSFEIAEDTDYAPQYDNIHQPVHLTVQHPATPLSEEFRAMIVYPGIEGIEFLRQFMTLDTTTLEAPITAMITEALSYHREYYERIPESKAALDRMADADTRFLQYTQNWKEQ